MQKQSSVGLVSSSKRRPSSASPNRHASAVGIMLREKSVLWRTFSFAIGCQKLGHLLPDSNLVSEMNSAEIKR
jgi:hypothetical protein